MDCNSTFPRKSSQRARRGRKRRCDARSRITILDERGLTYLQCRTAWRQKQACSVVDYWLMRPVAMSLWECYILCICCNHIGLSLDRNPRDDGDAMRVGGGFASWKMHMAARDVRQDPAGHVVLPSLHPLLRQCRQDPHTHTHTHYTHF